MAFKLMWRLTEFSFARLLDWQLWFWSGCWQEITLRILPHSLTIRAIHNVAACFIRAKQQVQGRKRKTQNHNLFLTEPELGSGQNHLCHSVWFRSKSQVLPTFNRRELHKSENVSTRKEGSLGTIYESTSHNQLAVSDVLEAEEKPDISEFPNKAFDPVSLNYPLASSYATPLT